MKKTIYLANCDLGVHVNGARLGPHSIINNINKDNLNIINFDQDPTYIKSTDKNDLRKNESEIMKFNTKLYNEMVNNNDFPILLGGDHVVAVPSALSSTKKNGKIGIIWIDAHTDYNTFETTVTGNIHGLPLAAITGYKCQELRAFHNGLTIDPKNCVVVGARAIDKDEMTNVIDSGITVFTTRDVHEKGCEYILNKAIEIASKDTLGVHISYDLDVIDPKIAPGVSVPEENGITYEEAMSFADIIVKNKDKMVSFDLVEYNPLLDKENKTAKIAVEILNKIINE
jgi:arginase